MYLRLLCWFFLISLIDGGKKGSSGSLSGKFSRLLSLKGSSSKKPIEYTISGSDHGSPPGSPSHPSSSPPASPDHPPPPSLMVYFRTYSDQSTTCLCSGALINGLVLSSQYCGQTIRNSAYEVYAIFPGADYAYKVEHVQNLLFSGRDDRPRDLRNALAHLTIVVLEQAMGYSFDYPQILNDAWRVLIGRYTGTWQSIEPQAELAHDVLTIYWNEYNIDLHTDESVTACDFGAPLYGLVDGTSTLLAIRAGPKEYVNVHALVGHIRGMIHYTKSMFPNIFHNGGYDDSD